MSDPADPGGPAPAVAGGPADPAGPGGPAPAVAGGPGASRSQDLAARVRASTPARLFVGGVAGAYRTSTQLQLRADHAAARDAVGARLDLGAAPLSTLVATHGLFDVASMVRSPAEHLLRPDLGRSLGPAARSMVTERCPTGADIQVVVGDGLSAEAVTAQVPVLLPLLHAGAARRGWSVGQPFVIHFCRVGVLNDIGDTLEPEVVVLLVGERPGLATARSLSAYLAWRPTAGHTDADRNLISNIHERGLPAAEASERILDLVAAIRAAGRSGVSVKEGPAPASRAPAVAVERR